MKRFFSHIVIIALLVIAPVSFSTTKIPNFDKPATRSVHLKEARKVTVAIGHQPAKPAAKASINTIEQIFILIPTLPAFDNTLEIPPGRAPPVELSV